MEDSTIVAPKTKKKFSYFKMIIAVFVVLIPSITFFAYLLFTRNASVNADTSGAIDSAVNSNSLQPALSAGESIDDLKKDVENTDLGNIEIELKEL